MKTLRTTVAAGTVMLLAAGCGDSPTENYQEAAAALEEAREARNEAQADLKEKQQTLEEIKQERQQAEQELEKARQRLQKAESGIDKAVSDEVLFRLVQSTMLNAEQFNKSAISVSVRDRVVLLTGTVPDEETQKAAVQTASDHPGVREVRSELKITSDQAGGGQKDQDNSQDKNKQKGGSEA